MGVKRGFQKPIYTAPPHLNIAYSSQALSMRRQALSHRGRGDLFFYFEISTAESMIVWIAFMFVYNFLVTTHLIFSPSPWPSPARGEGIGE